MDKSKVAILVLFCLGAIFLVVSSATTYWKRYKSSLGTLHSGIFKQCVATKSSSSCISTYPNGIGNVQAKFAAVVGSMVLAIIFIGVTLVAAVIGQFTSRKTGPIIIIMGTLTVLFAGFGLSVYANNEVGGGFKLYWSYGLGWVGAVFALVGTIVGAVQHFR